MSSCALFFSVRFQPERTQSTNEPVGVAVDADVFDDDHEGEWDSEEDEAVNYVETETTFEFDDYLTKFAKADVLRWFVSLDDFCGVTDIMLCSGTAGL